jgi:hypothetical protein
MSQFHEPWRFLSGNCDSSRSGGTVVNKHGEEIACDATDANHFPADEHWERIVACVNACAGLPTESLEKVTHLADLGQLIADQLDMVFEDREL